MQCLQYAGSTSEFFRLGAGVIVKKPMKVWTGNPNHKTLDEENVKALDIERQILEYLGSHERIVSYLGTHQHSGIKLAEASHGNLQAYIDNHNQEIDSGLRWKWNLQVVQPIVYLHQRGVMHLDLRLENYLVNSALDLWLCDFGGSTCEKLGLDGGHLPDDPFFDPQIHGSTPATDIFSLGSIFYTILTGSWPFRIGPAPVGSEKFAFQQQVHERFKVGEFPDVSTISGGKLIMGCWHHKLCTAEDVLKACKAEMEALGV